MGLHLRTGIFLLHRLHLPFFGLLAGLLGLLLMFTHSLLPLLRALLLLLLQLMLFLLLTLGLLRLQCRLLVLPRLLLLRRFLLLYLLRVQIGWLRLLLWHQGMLYRHRAGSCVAGGEVRHAHGGRCHRFAVIVDAGLVDEVALVDVARCSRC
jgi:hypothetical protein